MKIRTRLTLQFLLIGGIIMMAASLAIYYSFSGLRKSDFQKLLWNKARTTVNLLSNTSPKDADKLLYIEKQNPANLKNEKIIIINYNTDKIIYTTDENRELKITNEIVEKVRSGYIVTFNQPPYEAIGALFFNDFGKYVVIEAAIDTEGSQRLKNLLFILIIVCLACFVLFYLAGWVYSGRALRPISDMVKRVEAISISSLDLRLPESNAKDEIGHLARTFNNMLGRLETSFAVQKDFIANASHELRTPLTSINGQLEVLMLKERPKEEYISAMESVLEDIRSLIDISNRLLLMARASSETGITNRTKVRLDEIIWQAREEVMKRNPKYSINLFLDDLLTDSEQMMADGDEYMLKVAVSNIIENGCKYSADHSVNIRFEYPGNKVNIRFEDRGIGISGTDLKKIFEPFYRGENTLSYPGTGIGLALVSQILKSHNGSVEITSELGKGTKVVVSLPVAK